MSRQSKLTPEQWRELAAMIQAGMTLKLAAEYVLTSWGVEMAYQSIGQHQIIKDAIRNRRIMQRIEAGESLQDSLPGVTQAIVDRMTDLAKEAKEIRELTKDPSKPYYRTAMQRLASIDSALSSYLKPYREILDWIVREDHESPDGARAEKTAQEYLSSLDEMLKQKAN